MKEIHLIKKHLRRYDYLSRIGKVPNEDVEQEIRIALHEAKDLQEAFRLANSRVDKLCSLYGYSRKAGKGRQDASFPEFDIDTLATGQELTGEQRIILDILCVMYQKHTVKEIAAMLDVPFNNRLQKLFCRVFPSKRK